MSDLLKRIGVNLPVVQAGMAGGVSGYELAAAVSEAGGLGTVCLHYSADRLAREIRAARERTPEPLAVNLLLPFTSRRHAEVSAQADVVVTFWGKPERPNERPWLHQVGSVAEAVEAVRAGADGVIAQGYEAGGHVRGVIRRDELLERVRGALPENVAVLAAGGLADAADVRRVLSAGADAAVLGTRFVLSDESRAHPEYKRRLVEADRTLHTDLFGLGWPAPHRVVPNAATERWLGDGERTPGPIRLATAIAQPVLSRTPVSLWARATSLKRPIFPLLDPEPPIAGGPARLADAAPLYAGEGVARMTDVRPARELVRELAGA
jgi:NAD(P)H-dependent flavin oxidoreductase YrpB (nitropropane dioxygenase family)